MTETEPTPVRAADTAPMRRAKKFKRAFEKRFPFARTDIFPDEYGCPTFFAVVPPSYFEFRDRWLGYVVFGRTGVLVVVTEIRPDYSYCEVQTRIPYYEPPEFETHILEIFQEIIDRG